jgi:hypothetical protein
MTEFKGAKRSKEYRLWKAKHSLESKGLGDTIQKITKATGIEKAVKFIAGEDCGCDARQEKLNKLFPSNKPKCLEEDEYNLLADAVESKKNRFTGDEQKQFINIFERVFNTKVVGCSSCAFKSTVYNKLEQLYKNYK